MVFVLLFLHAANLIAIIVVADAVRSVARSLKKISKNISAVQSYPAREFGRYPEPGYVRESPDV